MYQIEMVNDQQVFFTIDKVHLEFLQSDEGKKYLVRITGFLFSKEQFPTYCLRDNEVHFRHWTVDRRLKNLNELGRTMTMTGMNLDACSWVNEFKFEYTFY